MFEALGKIFFLKIRPIFFFLILILPITLTFLFLYFAFNDLNDLRDEFTSLKIKARTAYEKKERKMKFLDRFQNSDPFYLDFKIESLRFLSDENRYLNTLLKHPALSDKRSISSRIQFLNGKENQLHFVEEEIRTSGTIKETVEKLKHPVQMGETDVKQVLSLLEDREIDLFKSDQSSPQFIVRTFKIDRKQTPLQTEVLEVDMELIKREFTP